MNISRFQQVVAILLLILVLLVSANLLNVDHEKKDHKGSGSISISNNILKVIIEDGASYSGIGTFTIRTDAGHTNPGENVFYDGASEAPWSTFTTIRVEDTLKEYVTSTDIKTPSSGYTVEDLDSYVNTVTRVSDTRATVSWTTPENLLVTLLIDIRGTTLADTMVETTVTIQNDDTTAHSVAVRHEWDLMIDGEDDSWIRVWMDPGSPQSWTETETDWVSPTFQFWETTNNPATPVFSVYGSAVLPIVDPPPTVPDRLVYAAWSDAYDTAYDFTPSGRSGMDSAVLYYWNAMEISPASQISRTAYVTTVVQAELEALAWSTDSAGNSESTFPLSDNVYVRGQDFPAETDVTIYLIPDGEDALPVNAIASASAATDTAGDVPVTLVWSQPLTTGEYDIWVDSNQNEVFDAGDVWNNQVGGIYAFSVIVEVGWIEGTVTDADTLLPIGGAAVSANGGADVTDSSGFYSIEVSPGTYDVTAEMTDYVSQTVMDMEVVADATTVQDFALNLVGGPSIESSDSVGNKKDTFTLSDTVYMYGNQYDPDQEYTIYVVADTSWTDGMAIPTRIAGTATTATSDASGNIAVTQIWSPPLTPGKYDIVVDVNGNDLYDIGIDALDDNDIQVTAGFFVIPEYTFGTILGLVAFFAAFGVFLRLKRIK